MKLFAYSPRNYGAVAPAINWAHPITRGLTGAFVPGHRYNIADGRFFTNPYATSPTLGSRQRGRAIIAGAYQTPEPANSSSVHAKFDRNVLTALVVTVQDTAQNAGHSFFRGNGSSTPGWLVGLWGGSSNGPYVTMGSWTTNVDLGANYTRTPHVIILSADGTTATCYADGVSVASSSYTAPTYQYSSARSVFFGSVNGINGATQERPSLGLFWNRPLTPNEIKLVSENPEIVFRPVSRAIFVPSGATETVINTSVGNATASGNSASVILATNINAGIGSASASGSTASIVLATNINAGVGDVVASGVQASVSSGETIDASVGAATASGLSASVSQATQINCQVGGSVAAGLSAQLVLEISISASVGSASAAGLRASILAGSNDLYPLAGLAETYPLTGAETYPLAGLI